MTLTGKLGPEGGDDRRDRLALLRAETADADEGLALRPRRPRRLELLHGEPAPRDVDLAVVLAAESLQAALPLQ